MSKEMWKTIYKMIDERQFTPREEMKQIIENVQNGTNRLTHEELVIKIGTYVPSQNCEGAAIGFFDIISKICLVQSELTDDLFCVALLPVYYLGIGEYENVQNWMEGLFETDIGRRFDESQRNWLKEKANDKKLIIKTLEKIVENEKMDE